MSTKIIETLLLLLSIASMLSPQVEGIQSNQTCVPIPKDKRQIVCQCSRSLQLRCLYNPEMLRMDASYLDATLRPIFYDDVNLDRIADPEDAFDPNTDFVSNRAKYSGSKNKFYIYFPNFEILTTPFVRITLTKFLYVPSFAFVNRQSGSRQRRQIESVVFELPNAFDFGIDENAFSSVDVTDTLLIEGPFNQINIHTNAFRNAKINELIFGCYCIECEYFIGECKLNFNQQASKRLLNGASAARRNNKKSTSGEISTEELIVNTTIKSIKLYGVEFNLNIDQIPGMESVQRLEITNLKSKSQPEFRSTRIYPKITEFYFKNNKLKQLSSLNAFYLFTNLRVASFAQNDIEKLDRDAFKFASLKSLEVLNLERNKIEKIERSVFGSSENLSNLKVLNLKQNNIQSIDDRAFAALEKLETLDLSRNRLNYLNENTFYGLKRLENLLLSYNPFKSFDVNTFKFVGSTLNRLDLVSNSESDWFTFDDSDVCLLSYLKCGVKIYINSDQRCNCFVKYLNYIGSSAAVESSSEDSEENLDNNDDPSVVWFKPCQFLDTPSSNLNKYFDEMNSFYEDLDSSSHVGVHGPKYNNIHSASGASDQKTSCPKQAIQSCFASSAAINTQSCLYRRFILNETILTTTQKSQATTLKQNEQSDSLESTIVLNKGSSQQQNKQYQTRQASEEQAKKGSSGDNAAPLVWRKFSLEDSLTALTVGITLAFVLSFISLFIGVYLIYKRKTFVYHPANDSSYPNDER